MLNGSRVIIFIINLAFCVVGCSAVSLERFNNNFKVKQSEIYENSMFGPEEEIHLSEQLSIMTGHVRAGLELLVRGEFDMAEAHLMHPISEADKDQKDSLKRFGLSEERFHELATLIRNGETEKLVLDKALLLIGEIERIQKEISSDTSKNILTLLRLASEEYSIALVDNMVFDTNEYQDAYGFILEAKHQSKKMHPAISGKTRAKLEKIQNLWVDGVIPTTTPTPEDDVRKSISQTVEELQIFWEDFH